MRIADCDADLRPTCNDFCAVMATEMPPWSVGDRFRWGGAGMRDGQGTEMLQNFNPFHVACFTGIYYLLHLC
jgi:hypothetical protein